MFRCTECQTEYKVKPNFCDCGNDIFEEIEETIEAPKKEKYKRSFEDMYPSLARFKESLDPISVSIFIVCIILSILSLIFLGNSKEEIRLVEDIREVVQTKVKDIDEIWDDTPVRIVQEKRNEDSGKIEKIEIKVVKPKAQAQNKVASKTTSNKPKQAAATAKPKTVKTPSQTSTKTQNQANTKTKTQTTPKTNAQTNTSANNNVQLKPPISQTNKTSQNTSEAQKAAAAQELKTYKNSLRNLLFSKIDFTQIQGDGTGIVSFKVESNGKLSNKTFVQRSNNVQLDDAIFYSLNTTSVFKAPPSSYKGETLKFRVKFVNGQYEVSLN